MINHAVAPITLKLVAAATPALATESIVCSAEGVAHCARSRPADSPLRNGGTLSLEGVGAWAVACPER